MHRYAPWTLIGTLAMAIALGIGLGLAEAPRMNGTSSTSLGIPATRSAPVKRPTPGPSTSSPTSSTTISAQPCNANSLLLATSALDTDEPPKLSEGALTLTNESSAACELSTTPVIEFIGATGTVVATTGPGKVANDLIRSGEAQGANLNWQNWCGADLRPLTLYVVLPSGGGTLSSPYGDASTMLPKCTDPSLPPELYAHGSGGPGTLLGG